MGRQLVPLTLDHLSCLPSRCRACVFWELDAVRGAAALGRGLSSREKEAWLSAVLREWGSCGRLVLVDGEPVGFALYAPPAYVPRAGAFPTSPVSDDAALLMTMWVGAGHQSEGLGRTLVQAMAKDLMTRGFRAIEAFGHAGPGGRTSDRCVLPVGYLLKVGFEVLRPHPVYPRLRLELRTAVSWRTDVGSALGRLWGARPITALHPL
ncbi:GNAT family N-acetyltransferase [Streptomyces sp. 4N509B]|uniref:GNAT family N-acetyltransferase n=1 Tax=Streptomyces sp. 4N509B TaxID=3457413 RepID=UPI003FD60334